MPTWDLLKTGARVWSFGPALLLPLFDGGRNQARTEQAQLQAEQAAIGYQKVAQTEFSEVADALAGAEHGAQQEVEAEQLQPPPPTRCNWPSAAMKPSKRAIRRTSRCSTPNAARR